MNKSVTNQNSNCCILANRALIAIPMMQLKTAQYVQRGADYYYWP